MKETRIGRQSRYEEARPKITSTKEGRPNQVERRRKGTREIRHNRTGKMVGITSTQKGSSCKQTVKRPGGDALSRWAALEKVVVRGEGGARDATRLLHSCPIQSRASQHGDESVILFPPAVPPPAVLLDRPVYFPPELALLPIFRSSDCTEFVCGQFNGC